MAAPSRPSSFAAAAWVLYDLANTVYAAALTFLFTPFYEDAFGERTSLGLTQTLSMLLAGVLVPVYGAILDRTSRAGLYLSLCTLACIAAMAGWGASQEKAWLLGCFFAANVTYNLGLLFYNSLLPAVARPERAGFVSGLGVGLGYVGTILVLVVLMPIATASDRFYGAAAMFLLLALPCMLLVRDRRKPTATEGSWRAALDSLRALRATLRDLPRQRSLFWFLLANFCLVDVLNTAVLFFVSFTRNVFGDAARNGTLVLFDHVYRGDEGLAAFVQISGLCLNGLALVFGVALGLGTDRRPLLVMRLSAVALLLALIGGAYFGGNSPLAYLASLVLLGAFGLSGIWTAGRKVVVLLAPPERIGEFFGLYGITVKLSVVGSTVYAVVADHFGTKQAMLSQSLQLGLGLAFLALVRLPRSCDAVRPA